MLLPEKIILFSGITVKNFNSLEWLKNKMRITNIKLIIITFLLIICSQCTFAQQEKFVLRVGVIPLVEQLPLVIAQTDLSDVSRTDVIFDIYNSWTALEAAFRTEALDAVAITLPKALVMAYDGVPLKIILVINRNGNSIVMKSDSAAELKGKIIGSSGSDTMDLLIFSRFLKSKDLKSGYDVRSLLIPLEKSISLLEGNRIYGFCLPEPYGTMAEKRQIAKKIVFSKDIYPNHIGSVLIIKPAILKAHPEEIKSYLKSILHAASFIESDKKESNGMQTALAQVGVFHLDYKIVAAALSVQKERVLFSDLTPSVNEIEEVMRAAMEIGILKGSINLKETVDASFVK